MQKNNTPLDKAYDAHRTWLFVLALLGMACAFWPDQDLRPPPALKVDLARADFNQLVALPTVGPKRASAIRSAALMGASDNNKQSPLDGETGWLEKLRPFFTETAVDSNPGNLLPNPSFEKADPHAEDKVPGWITRAWSGRQAGHWRVATPGRTGQRCLSIRSDQGTDAAWTAVVAVKPGTFYKLSGWIKTHEINGAAGALLNIQNMQQVRTEAVSGTKDWTLVSATFNSAKEMRLEINCLFGGWGRATGEAFYDDVTLEEVDGQAGDYAATVTIDPDVPSVPYSRLLFGGFIEHFHHQVYGGIFEPGSSLSDARGFRLDVIAAVKELKISIVRWPGGCFASGYHWVDGVGRERKPVPDPVWGVVEPNTFGTDEFVEWCRLINSEPYICTNAGNGTPQEMRDWVEYCNGKQGKYAALRKGAGQGEPLGVRYWSIGNENWGSHEMGAKKPAVWGPLVKDCAERMLGADPSLVLLAAATPNRHWTLPLLKAAGQHLDYVCIHQYWLGLWQRNTRPGYLDCIMHSEGPEQTITRVADILSEAGVRDRIKIAFDEWNMRGWHHPGFPRKKAVDPEDKEAKALVSKRDLNAMAAQYTMADALFSASFLNACLRHADIVGMANIAPIVNTRGPLFVHPKGIVKRTTFHTLSLYANHLEKQVAQAKWTSDKLYHGARSIPVVDGIVTVNSAGTLWAIALVNRHPTQQAACTIRLKDTLLAGDFPAIILSGDSPDAYNDMARPNRVVPQKKNLTFNKGVTVLPPHSLTIVKVQQK